MQINDKQLQQIGEFTYLFLRFERYLVDTGHCSTNKNGFIYPDIKSYYANL